MGTPPSVPPPTPHITPVATRSPAYASAEVDGVKKSPQPLAKDFWTNIYYKGAKPLCMRGWEREAVIRIPSQLELGIRAGPPIVDRHVVEERVPWQIDRENNDLKLAFLQIHTSIIKTKYQRRKTHLSLELLHAADLDALSDGLEQSAELCALHMVRVAHEYGYHRWYCESRLNTGQYLTCG
ncbi:hypothetical protein C8F01DRAFT_1092375 [Mycena amicta]|nr:hypothetical protein C8F01DRAFT_1092375 [Mycena amicta]